MTESVFDNGFKRITTRSNGDDGSIRFIIKDLITGLEIVAAFTGVEVLEIAENMENAVGLEMDPVDVGWDIDYHSRHPGD